MLVVVRAEVRVQRRRRSNSDVEQRDTDVVVVWQDDTDLDDGKPVSKRINHAGVAIFPLLDATRKK